MQCMGLVSVCDSATRLPEEALVVVLNNPQCNVCLYGNVTQSTLTQLV